MKVAVYYNNHDVRVEEKPLPEPDEGEMLVKTKSCGVCVADTMEWYLQPRAPLILGHEPTGIVTKIGSNVTQFKEGDAVAVHHHVPCLICEHCLRGNFTMCATFKRTHILPGGFSEYFIASSIHIERDTFLLPDSMGFEVGTLIEPLACVVHAIEKAGIKPGDRVVLIGTGAMGLMFIQALRAWGVRDLIVYEVLEWRKQKAVEFGADAVFSPSDDPEEESRRVKAHFGTDGADKVIIAAKDLRAMDLGMKLARKGGLVLFFATPHPDEYVKLFPSYIFFNEITIISSYSASHLDTRMAFDLLERGLVNGKAVITHRFPLEKLSDAILQTQSREGSLKCIINFD
jgi:L-iditol 2-dehydrogenase